MLEGSIRRGDGEEIEAAVRFADLRGSTAMAERLPRGLYPDALNAFFDATAGSVADRGGEVLKFIGDAVLAIFPVEESSPDACVRALAAARGALARLDGLNEYRDPEWPALGAVLALHLGAASFGNIGTADRLDFTAIGPAVNETARLAEATSRPGGRCSPRGPSPPVCRTPSRRCSMSGCAASPKQCRSSSRPDRSRRSRLAAGQASGKSGKSYCIL